MNFEEEKVAARNLITKREQKVTMPELAKIRGLDDFDLVMLISEIHDNGWAFARRTLAMMPPMDIDRANWLARNTGHGTKFRAYKNLKDYFSHLIELLSEAESKGLTPEETDDYMRRHTSMTMTTDYHPEES